MKIKFLRDCIALQDHMKVCCPCCGPERMGKERTFFSIGEEADPEEYGREIDLSGLTLGVDYHIIEFP